MVGRRCDGCHDVCVTQSGGVGCSSATRTTRMVASGCASTATYACAVGSTLPQAECTTLVLPPSLFNNGSALKTSPGWTEITDSDSQHMEPISDAVAAHNAQSSVMTPRLVVVPAAHAQAPQQPDTIFYDAMIIGVTGIKMKLIAEPIMTRGENQENVWGRPPWRPCFNDRKACSSITTEQECDRTARAAGGSRTYRSASPATSTTR